MRRRSISPAIAFLVAGMCWAIAAGFAIHTFLFLRGSIRTAGTIVELRARSDGEGSTTYAPTFTFRDATGAEHQVESTLYQSPEPYTNGQSVPVLYRASNPASARIDRFMELWFVPFLLGSIGASWGIIGAVLFVRRRGDAVR